MAEKHTFKIMVVTGEASGDTHAAGLVRALREISDNIKFEFFGATGHNLRAAKVEQIVKSDDFSVVGLLEIGKVLPMFWRAFQKLKQTAVQRKADAVILVDFPDFNLKLAKALKKQGLKVIYYISPQLWAWRKYRLRTIKNHVDLLLTILPFEKEWYARNGVFHVEYVGHPTVREIHAELSKAAFCQKYQLDAKKPIVALLPGSRHKEITRILPVLLETAALMAEKNSDLQFVIALAATRKLSEVEDALNLKKDLLLPKTIITVRDATYSALKASDAAAVTSGTATLETGIIGTPLAIVYKSSPLNYTVLRPLISVEHFGLINLVAAERLAKEFIQNEFTPEILAAELFRLLEPDANLEMRQKLSAATAKLGHGAAAKRAAQAICKILTTVDARGDN